MFKAQVTWVEWGWGDREPNFAFLTCPAAPGDRPFFGPEAQAQGLVITPLIQAGPV
jgi:hypothetical protein